MINAKQKYTVLMFLLGTNIVGADDINQGQQLYLQNCVVCHAEDGSGAMPGVADLTEVRAWSTESEASLLLRIKQGITGKTMAMPPSGGNPALSDTDLKKIILYMRDAFMK